MIRFATALAAAFAFALTPSGAAAKPAIKAAVKTDWSHVVKATPEGPMGLNTIIRQQVSAPVVGEVAADTQITAWDPPHGYAFKVIAGPIRPEGTIGFAPVGDAGADGTAVTFKLNVDIRGPQKFLFTKPTQNSMNATVAALDKVKAILEDRTGQQ